MRTTMRGTVAMGILALGTTTLGACAPVLSHGPRVQPGTSVGASLAMLDGGRNGERMTALIPYLTSAERYDDGSATQFTVQLVIPTEALRSEQRYDSYLNGVQMDYFRELPTSDPATAHGRGIHLSIAQLMGYAQWGVYSDRFGIHTTQGIGTVGPYFGLPPEAVFWSPGAGVSYETDAFTVRAQVSVMALWSMRTGFVEDLPVTTALTFQLGGDEQR